MSYQRIETSSPANDQRPMHRLTPWNPLDQLLVLFSLYFYPAKLKLYKAQYGTEGLKRTGIWLYSTLLWLPLFLYALILAIDNNPLFYSPFGIPWILWGMGIIGAWLLSPLMEHYLDDSHILSRALGILAGFAFAFAAYIHSYLPFYAPFFLLQYAVAVGVGISPVFETDKSIARRALIFTGLILIVVTFLGMLVWAGRYIYEALFWLPFFFVPLVIIFGCTIMIASGISNMLHTERSAWLRALILLGVFAAYFLQLLSLLAVLVG